MATKITKKRKQLSTAYPPFIIQELVKTMVSDIIIDTYQRLSNGQTKETWQDIRDVLKVSINQNEGFYFLNLITESNIPNHIIGITFMYRGTPYDMIWYHFQDSLHTTFKQTL